MDNHANRPEIKLALAEGRGSSIRVSATTGLQYVYAAHQVRSPAGDLYLIRLAQPVIGLKSLRWQLAIVLVITSIAALIALSVWLVWLTNRISKSAPKLLEAADQLEKGDFSHRVDVIHQDELGRLARFLNKVAERAERQIGDLESERGLLMSVMSSMREGVLVTTDDGLSKMANPAFCEIFGVQGDWTNRTPLELTRQPKLEELITETLTSGEERVSEIELDTPGLRHVAVATSQLGEGRGAVVVARDVTDLVQLTQMRRDFVANVSHELKTPLTAIRGFAETLRDGAINDGETAHRFLDRILQQCSRLQALLEDLLTLSRLESLEGKVEADVVPLASLVQDCLEPIDPQVEEKQIRVEVSTEAHSTVQGDREALERLVINLLDNAVKYNRVGGSVTIRLGAENDEAILEVVDTGIGIPAGSLNRVFERFYRVDKGRSRDEGGTGLGLAIVKHVAQLHGGRVEVSSELGRGSRFRVRLPTIRRLP
ncbi:MAG: ATP-binding protein [Acidobacteriota bacterium]